MSFVVGEWRNTVSVRLRRRGTRDIILGGKTRKTVAAGRWMDGNLKKKNAVCLLAIQGRRRIVAVLRVGVVASSTDYVGDALRATRIIIITIVTTVTNVVIRQRHRQPLH